MVAIAKLPKATFSFNLQATPPAFYLLSELHLYFNSCTAIF